jgi:hypothetical protein
MILMGRKAAKFRHKSCFWIRCYSHLKSYVRVHVHMYHQDHQIKAFHQKIWQNRINFAKRGAKKIRPFSRKFNETSKFAFNCYILVFSKFAKTRNVLCNTNGPFCVSRTTSSTLTGAATRGENWWYLPPIRDFLKLQHNAIWSVTNVKYYDFLY